MSRRTRIILKAAVWAACLFPLAGLLFLLYADDVGANPIDYVTRTLGDWTLRLLLASLALTPLRLLFGISWQMSLRRLLGLFAFCYATLHFGVWIVVDHFFDWAEMSADVVKRPYITVGVLALTLLLPLAATSTTGMVKRLGGRNWQRLHKLVYLVGVLAVLHYLWLAKKGVTDPFYYGAVLAVLLGIRLVDWARRAARRTREVVAGVPRPTGRSKTVAAVGVAVLTLLGATLVALPRGAGAQRAPRLGQFAPEIAGGPWINSAPLTMSGLKGGVVFVEFWTYG